MAKSKESEKVEMTVSDLEIQSLTHTAWEMARVNIPELEKNPDFKDHDLVELSRKARKYLHLVFDKVIEKHKRENKNE